MIWRGAVDLAKQICRVYTCKYSDLSRDPDRVSDVLTNRSCFGFSRTLGCSSLDAKSSRDAASRCFSLGTLDCFTRLSSLHFDRESQTIPIRFSPMESLHQMLSLRCFLLRKFLNGCTVFQLAPTRRLLSTSKLSGPTFRFDFPV